MGLLCFAQQSKQWRSLHYTTILVISLQWRHNGRDSVSNHQPHDCLLFRLFKRRSKKTSKLRATGLCAGNSPLTGEYSAQMARNAENVSIWWRNHAVQPLTMVSSKWCLYVSVYGLHSTDIWLQLPINGWNLFTLFAAANGPFPSYLCY